MDPINILLGINIVALFGANMSGAKKGLKSQITAVKEKPKSNLQKVPYLSALILLIQIISLFGVGTLEYSDKNQVSRLTAGVIYILFSWLQIWAYRTMGPVYSQEIVVLKNHSLITSGPYSLIRHPQYLAQIIADTAIGFALLSYLVLPLVVLEIPLVIMRASLEDKLMARHFNAEFAEYRKKTGFIIPFLG